MVQHAKDTDEAKKWEAAFSEGRTGGGAPMMYPYTRRHCLFDQASRHPDPAGGDPSLDIPSPEAFDVDLQMVRWSRGVP